MTATLVKIGADLTLTILDQITNFIAFRKSIEFVLGEDQLTIEFHVKNSTVSLNEFRDDLELLLNTIRQPGGIRQVVSLHAVLNTDLQVKHLSRQGGLIHLGAQ